MPSYEEQLRELAKSIGSDGCTHALQVHQVCCWEHDWAYVTGTTPRGVATTKAEADARFRRCLQLRSPFRKYSPLSWWRWLAVKWFGRGHFDKPIQVPRKQAFMAALVASAESTSAALAEARARRLAIVDEQLKGQSI